MLSIVDNRTFRRLICEVLDHDPTKADIERFLGRFRAELDQRGMILKGVTTDGSPLYPDPLAKVFPGVPHQICVFHVIKELTKAILKAVAKIRKSITAGLPEAPRGRPASQEAKRAARMKKRSQKKVADLFDHRHLFVQHHLTAADRRTLSQITRGLPHLKTLRETMDEVYRLFDRRCSTHTALAKLARLRNRIQRFKKVGKTLQKLSSPNLQKALVFLDDSLLPSTSNAVERGNRRHRKMQKSVYGVRTHKAMVGRMALDLLRDRRLSGNASTLLALHRSRGSPSASRPLILPKPPMPVAMAG